MSQHPSALQVTVLERHNHDQESAESFIQKEWPVPKAGVKVNPVDMDSMITYAVSTTSSSSLLLIARGMRTMFTRNSYSADAENPWLIFQNVEENQGLAQHVQGEWDNMAIDPNGSREEVNKVAAHVLYQKQNGNWVFVPFSQSDSFNVVRFSVDDVEIWSHPPRDEPLMAAVKEKYKKDEFVFERAVGDLKGSVKALDGIKNNTKIPSDQKPQAVQRKRDDIARKFSKIYSYYSSVDLPDSYQWPTLGQSKRVGTELQRYGGTFAGVFTETANQVHMKFCAPGVEARELPTQQTIFDSLLRDKTFGLKFEDVFGS